MFETMKKSSQVLTAVVFYWIVSISLVFINKLLFSGKSFQVNAPLFITWSQCLVTVFCCYALGGLSWTKMPQFEVHWKTCVQLLPLSFIFTLMVVFNNICLKYVEVSFYQVARSLTIIFNVALDFMLLGQQTSPAAIFCCLIVVSGFWLGNREELRWSLIGVISGVTSSFFVAMNAIYVKKMYPFVDNDPWKITLYNNVNACLLFLPFIYFSGEVNTLMSSENVSNPSFWIMLSMSGLLGILISFATATQIKYTSPLTHNVSATAKAAAQTAIALLLFQNPVTGLGLASICIVLLGSLSYSIVRRRDLIMKLRILFLGDTGVGKSSLIQDLCSYSGSVQTSLHESLRPTKGFSISCIILPLSVERETMERKTIVELWEWGGFPTSTSVFQRAFRSVPFDGIVFVYDLTISSTRDSLWKYWAVQVQNSFGDVEGGIERDNRNSYSFWRESGSLKKAGETLRYLFLQILSSVLPYVNQQWKEKMETYYLYELSQQFPVAVIGKKSDIWSQRRKLKLHKSNPTHDKNIFYGPFHTEQAIVGQDRCFWNFLSAVLERKSNKINKYY
ncbi:sugar-phosphate:phosphate translocator, DMT family isoform 1 [Galdieria sulphuraria]|uniref:Sugar-phosphate:phosphate translocator, DMT family isoform 1 n=1 Tax=Galdieria sulphuraria TaxID=130081 RepID=M2YAH5_GALSU|nr:sugar-phosphate:phosphate translocator, DMT family isoform 1 [Galdieria sulphuraria]EME32879.1 sugar-phosphate:phosphate translocator, DMT family isoform 1 [Galdieria sulphuraria]|eukprot:XP_005709399.1 sugar-phosphate:phosphate translocator, DMT family isoform 1 [Galdieria sulphuraria]